MERAAMKTSYSVKESRGRFYTGGKVAALPNEDAVACPCAEQVKIVELESGRTRCTFAGDSEIVTAIAVHPNGELVASASRSLQLYLWECTAGTVTSKRSFRAHEGNVVTAMEFDTTGHYLCTGAADGTLRVWDTGGWYCTHHLKGHRAVITKILFHPDPHRYMVISGGEDGSLRCWDMVGRKGACSELTSHDSAVTGLAVSSCGWILVSGSRDKTMSLWDLRKFTLLTSLPVYEAVECIRTLPVDMELISDQVTRTSFKTAKKGASCSSFQVVLVGDRGELRIFELKQSAASEWTSKQLENQPNAVPGTIYKDLIVLPNRRSVLTVSAEHHMELHEVKDVADSARHFHQSKLLLGNMDELIDVCYLPSHRDLIAFATNSEHVKILDLQTQNCTILGGHTDIVLALAASSARFVASASKDNTIRIWEVDVTEDRGTLARCRGICTGHTASVGAVCFAQRSTAFLVSVAEDRTLKVWDMTTLEKSDVQEHQLQATFTVVAHSGDVNCVAVSPNDKMIATGSQDKTVKVWQFTEGKVKSLVLAGTCSGHKRTIWSVAFSPVDLCLASSSGDHTIKLWSLKDCTCLKTLEGHSNSVLRVSFISSGMQLLSTSSDTLVKLWNIKTSECVATMDGHQDKIWALAVGPNDEHFVTGGSDSTLNIWEDRTAALAAEKNNNLESKILHEQELANLVRQKQFVKAAEIAFVLDQPFRLLGVLESLIADGKSSGLDSFLAKLSQTNTMKLLRYIRDWNTNPRFAAVAQLALGGILRGTPPDQLVKYTSISEVLAGLIPYTERHLARANRLYRSSFVLDGALSSMSILAPQVKVSKKRKSNQITGTNVE